MFSQFFYAHEPIRRPDLGSSKGCKSITMVETAIKSDTIPPIEEWDLNPEVSNQVY